jgi:hypothetical protein
MNNEPVAWLIQAKIWHEFTFSKPAEDSEDVVITPLYTHPSEHALEIAEAIGFDKGYKAATAKTLTDEEIHQIFRDETGFEIDTCPIAILDFARAILRNAQEADKIESLGTVNIGGVHFRNGKEVK